MKPGACSHEKAILTAVRSHQWSDSLRAHFAECTLCQEVASVASWMRALAAEESQPDPLPDPRLIWLKSRLQERQVATARALWPLEIFHRIACTVLVLVLFAAFVLKWPLVRAGVSYSYAAWSATVSSGGVPFTLLALVPLSLGLLGLAAILTLNSSFAKN
jgi:hypothetical protein